MQLLRLTKTNGGELWINPEKIVYAEIGKKSDAKEAPVRDPKTAAARKEEFITVLHVEGKDGKVFVQESPSKINEIIRGLKRTVKKEVTISG
jgi:uncharacterized protein YlzI (FlbEa/FlbD family)